MTATDELRRMLDERGVEYEATNENVTTVYLDDSVISYFHQKGKFSAEIIIPRPRLNATEWLTPEQVIEATLGKGTCRVMSRRQRDGRPYLHDELVCSECGCHLAEEFGHAWQRFCPNCGREVIS